jgi:hypothetical protein
MYNYSGSRLMKSQLMLSATECDLIFKKCHYLVKFSHLWPKFFLVGGGGEGGQGYGFFQVEGYRLSTPPPPPPPQKSYFFLG